MRHWSEPVVMPGPARLVRHCHGCNQLAPVADLHVVWRDTISALLCDSCVKALFERNSV